MAPCLLIEPVRKPTRQTHDIKMMVVFTPEKRREPFFFKPVLTSGDVTCTFNLLYPFAPAL